MKVARGVVVVGPVDDEAKSLSDAFQHKIKASADKQTYTYTPRHTNTRSLRFAIKPANYCMIRQKGLCVAPSFHKLSISSDITLSSGDCLAWDSTRAASES